MLFMDPPGLPCDRCRRLNIAGWTPSLKNPAFFREILLSDGNETFLGLLFFIRIRKLNAFFCKPRERFRFPVAADSPRKRNVQYSPGQLVVMNLKKTCILLVIITGLVACSGCTGNTGPAPQSTVLTPEPVTPLTTATTVTRLPVNELARITVDHFGMNPATESIYEFVGTLHVNDGPYRSVQVILRYPDSQEYVFDFGGMGGANQTLQPFSLFPGDRYIGTNPEKIVVLDGKRYGTVYRYEDGVLAWIATPDTLMAA
jgi:hypothetical protein